MTPRWRAFFFLPLLGCSPIDPVHTRQVDALGPENPSVPVGARHRAGQPCAVCHSDLGGAPTFSVAGTVYRDNMGAVALPDVAVDIVDSQKRSFTAHSNCAGNFYVTPGQFQPVAPFWVTLRFADVVAPMESPIHREASCGACHVDPAGMASAGHVYVTADDLAAGMITPRACRPDE